jgi:hypothetical protein
MSTYSPVQLSIKIYMSTCASITWDFKQEDLQDMRNRAEGDTKEEQQGEGGLDKQ